MVENHPVAKEASYFFQTPPFLLEKNLGGFILKKIVFIGAGSMAEAIIQGWISKNVVESENIYVMNRSNMDRLNELNEKFNVQIIKDKEQLLDVDLIVLAIKPKDLHSALSSIRDFIKNDAAVLSVVAGISISTIEELLGNRPVARVMPNTSAMIGMSASGISFNEQVSDIQKKVFLEMLEAVGIVIEVEEDQLHAVTALSGSGPAYLYYLLEAWEQIGTEFGLSKEIVRKLMVQTMAGAAAMLEQVKEEPNILRKKVTSPGGTTEAGIKALENYHFKEAIYECIKKAEERSRELAEGK